MDKAVRSVVVHRVSESMCIAAVLLDRYCMSQFMLKMLLMVLKFHRVKTIFLFKINGEEPTFQRQTIHFLAQPLETAFTEEGSLYVLTDSVTNPIEFLGKDESFQYTLGESAVIGTLLANANHLKIIQGN